MTHPCKTMRKHETAWAWAFEGTTVRWASPYIADLTDGVMPEPESRAIQVRIVPEGDYRKLMAAWRKQEGK